MNYEYGFEPRRCCSIYIEQMVYTMSCTCWMRFAFAVIKWLDLRFLLWMKWAQKGECKRRKNIPWGEKERKRKSQKKKEERRKSSIYKERFPAEKGNKANILFFSLRGSKKQVKKTKLPSSRQSFICLIVVWLYLPTYGNFEKLFFSSLASFITKVST